MLEQPRYMAWMMAGALCATAIAGCANKDAPEKKANQTVQQKQDSGLAHSNGTDDDLLVDSSQMPGRIHVVQAKETMMLLAERYYKDRAQWRRIWQANKNRVTNPDDLPVGMKLIIP